jgi:ABC-type sulfate transport system permease subunit
MLAEHLLTRGGKGMGGLCGGSSRSRGGARCTSGCDYVCDVLIATLPRNIFFRVTLPRIRWGLVYGVILCNARAMGEFGAVSVVSGNIRGLTTTMPLHIEILYNEYNFVGAFAVASMLSLLAVVTLIIKTLVERGTGYRRR